VLAVWLLGFQAARLSGGERVWLALLASGTIAVHQSHLPLALGLTGLGALLLWSRSGARRAMTGALRMGGPAVLAAFALLGANLAGHGRASLSPFGSVFVAARLIADGPALEMLHERCPEAGWRICAMLDRLGPAHNDFLWNPGGPLRAELGGAKAWAPEASAIIAATLRAAPGEVVGGVAANTLRQYLMLGTGDGLEAWPAEPGPEPLVAAYFSQEHALYAGSRQNRGLLQPEAEALSPLHQAVAWAGLLALPVVLLLRRRQIGLAEVAFGLFVLAASLGNAAITGGLSGPAIRYQARLTWIFVLAPAALVAVPTPAAQRRRSSVGQPVQRPDAA
jgi:hypothetical protein